ncbi:MAG: lipase family protein [Planctomycetota bacterium]
MARRIGCVLILLVLASGAFLFTSCGTIRAGRMVLDATRPASELAPYVTESELAVGAVGGRVPTRIYRPVDTDGALPAIVLVHGAVTGGADEPRFVALARAMAKRGATIATPDLASLRRFRLDRSDPERVAAAACALANRSDLTRDGRVALVGISVGGSYCLLAARDPRLAGRVSTILSFGAYADLDGLVRRWMTDPRSDAPELLDPQTYGRRMVLHGNLDILVPPDDVTPVRDVIARLLNDQSPGDVPPELSPAGRRVVEVAISEDAIDPAVVADLLRPLEAGIRGLSPVRRDEVPDAPVYLLHGVRDPVVPVADLERLAVHLRDRGVDVETHETDVFGHVKRTGEGHPSLFEAWPLFSFLADVWSDAGF